MYILLLFVFVEYHILVYIFQCETRFSSQSHFLRICLKFKLLFMAGSDMYNSILQMKTYIIVFKNNNFREVREKFK